MGKRIVTAAMALAMLVGFTVCGRAQTLELQITKRPRAQHVTKHSATIRWITNVPASSLVRYGTDREHLSQTAKSEDGEIHTIELNNLRSGTVYYYQVVSSAGLTGTSVISEEDLFITHGESVLYETEPIEPAS